MSATQASLADSVKPNEIAVNSTNDNKRDIVSLMHPTTSNTEQQRNIQPPTTQTASAIVSVRQLRAFLNATFPDTQTEDFIDWLYQQINGQREQLNPLLRRLLKLGILEHQAGTWRVNRSTWAPSLNLTSASDSEMVGESNLPLPMNPLVERQQELDEIGTLLKKHPFVTILGLGGSGKTRLAIQSAYHHLDSYADGVYFVNLAGVSHSILLLPTLISELPLQLQGAQDPKAQLLDYLHYREMLLVLDNYEQLLPNTELLSEILAQAPNITLLVTSRVRLSLPAEGILELGGLGLEREQTEGNAEVGESAAARLFVDAAMRADPTYAPIGTDRNHIQALCEAVSGLPLGVELAAAWVRVLSVHAIVEELSKDINLLVDGRSDTENRHQSLVQVFDYSWHLLETKEQRVFCQLALFADRFAYSAAIAVTGASLLTLRTLVDSSLIQVDEDKQMQLHPLVKQYAAQKLADDVALQQLTCKNHADHYMTLLQAQDARINESEVLEALNLIDESLGDIRLAWDWMLEAGEFAQLAACAYPLARFYQYRSRFFDGLEHFSQGVEILSKCESGGSSEVGQMQAWKAFFLMSLFRNDEAAALTEPALLGARAYGNNRWQVICLSILSVTDIKIKPEDRASRSYQLRTLSEESKDHHGLLVALTNLVDIARLDDDPELLKQLRQPLEELVKSTANPYIKARANNTIAGIVHPSDERLAESYCHSSLDAATRLGDQRLRGMIFNNLSLIYHSRGTMREAGKAAKAAYLIARRLGSIQEQVRFLLRLGSMESECGEFMAALGYYNDADKICIAIDSSHAQMDIASRKAHLFICLGAYDLAQTALTPYLTIPTDTANPTQSHLIPIYQGLIALHQGRLKACEEYTQIVLGRERKIITGEGAAFLAKYSAYLLLRSKHIIAAKKLFNELYELTRKHSFPYNAMDVMAGLAEIALLDEEHDVAVAHVEKLLPMIEQHGIDGTLFRTEIYLICVNVFDALKDPRCNAIAKAARQYVEERAKRITDPMLQKSYMTNIPTHRLILGATWHSQEPNYESSSVKKQAINLLTRREMEVLNLLAANHTNQEISDSLVLSLATVKRHVSNIFQKLDVNRRGQAITKAQTLGLLKE